MKDLHRASVMVAALVGLAGGASALAVGCGTDDAGTVDASSDGSTDVVNRRDVHTSDVGSRKDAPHHVDAGAETGPGFDGGQDTGFDTGHDTGTDGGKDATHDTGVDSPVIIEAGGADVYSQLVAYPGEVTQTYCQRFAQCCGNSPEFSVDTCMAIYGEYGAFGNVATVVVDSGHLSFNPSLAGDCLTRVATLPCASITSLQEMQTNQACAAAISGQLIVGQTGCKSAWDCKQPAYCNLAADGGLCAAILAPGAACSDKDTSEDCNSLGITPGAYCGPASSTTPHCFQAEMEAGTCEENQQCNSFLCSGSGFPLNCVPSEPFAQLSDGGSCTFYPDGG